MHATLGSLLLRAIALLMRSTDISLPAPLGEMARRLTGTRSYRMVMVNMQTMGASVSMHRAETVVVRRGQSLDSYTILRINAADHVMHAETINTPTATYQRRDLQGAWTQSKPEDEQPNALLTQALEALGTAARWTALGEEQIRGELCAGHQVTRVTDGGGEEQATLWIARDSLRPVELLALTMHGGRLLSDLGIAHTPISTPHMILSQVVAWSEWDSTALAIPVI